MSEYIRVRLTSERLDPEGIPRVLESLHKLSTPTSSGLGSKLNPFHSSPPPHFEFLGISEGAGDPVEFFYGADSHLDTLEKQLRSIYPQSFDIEQVELDLRSRLIPPVEYSREEFIEQYKSDNLDYEFGPDEQYDHEGAVASTSATAEHVADGGTVPSILPDHHVPVDETVLELAPPETLPEDEELNGMDKPTLTPEGTVLARPAVETVSPLGVQWHSSAKRKKDWMTSLKPFTTDITNNDIESVDKPGAALASLIDHLMESAAPVAFQVVFKQRYDWQTGARTRKQDIVAERDTLFQKILRSIFPVNDEQLNRDERELDESVSKRIDYIDAKNSRRSFTANIRAIGVPTEDTADDLDTRMESLKSVFDELDGPFYEIRGKRLRDKGFREKTKEKNARSALNRTLNRELTTGRGKTRPELALCGTELAHFVLVPSSEQLTIEGQRGTRAEQRSRNPLPWPDPGLIQQFQQGMSIGFPINEDGEPEPDPIRISPELLTTHYGRFGSTGSGKSKAIINDALSLREETGGPVVIVDPKGDGMCDNYLKCHYERFGDLQDVHHFRVPSTIPAFSFFDIRPALEAGRNRKDAIQDKVDHFHDIMRMVMGREQYGQAFVANEILSYLIKALFDEVYGSDVFGLDDLFTAAIRMQRDQALPPLSAANQNVEQSLSRHFAKDDRQFQLSMDAVGNRLDKLKEDDHLRRIFNHAPARNDAGEYVDNYFDFTEFLNNDVTILFDLGDLRQESQQALTLLMLSNLWDVIQLRRRESQMNYENLVNLIIEESAPVASSTLVSEQLLPEGRSFGLSMGLVMQFPGQVRSRNERAYDEVLNNTKTKLIGNISIENELAESLAHESLSPTELRNRINTLPSGEWIAQLPSPSFGETGPAPFSLKPLPIAPGHPESDQPLSTLQQDQFESVVRPQMENRTRTEYGLSASTEPTLEPDKTSWGASERPKPFSSESDASSTDPAQTSIIDTPTDSTVSVSDRNSDSSQSEPMHHAQETASTSSNGNGPPEDEPEDNDSELTTSLFDDLDLVTDSAGEADESQDEETQDQLNDASIPLGERDIPVSDRVLEERGLSRDDVRFLSRVLDVMNREDNEYTLLDSMTSLRDDFENLSIDRLKEQGLIEEETAAKCKYYTVLPEGRALLPKALKVGPGKGDVGEKTPHKVGVKLLESWIEQQDGVDRVQSYYRIEDGTVFDVAGFNSHGDLVWVGEAEIPSNNPQAAINDYDQLSAVDANVVWAFDSHSTATDIINRFSETGRIESKLSGRETRDFPRMREALREFDAAGITTVYGFTDLKQEVDL